MQFTTPVPIKKAEKAIGYTSQIMLLGSCFSDSIGEKFNYSKFKTLANPFGVLFSPTAIYTLIERAVDLRLFTISDLVFHNELWHCLEVHSQFSNPNSEQLLAVLNEELKKVNEFLKNTSHVFITFGTAWVYKHIAKNIRVANCHKMPQKEFQKQLLSVEEVARFSARINEKLKALNSNVSIVFTVSPVRHIKDGFEENNRSKAHLIAGIHQANSGYFPSYEIMMDELRDYRFYSSDMLHPTVIAVDYIWQKLSESFIDEATQKNMQLVAEIQNGLAHKPFHPEGDAHQRFLEKLEQKIATLANQKPPIIF